MSEIRDRHVLYARLEETLGAEPAGILMRQLPPTDDLLTKADLREFFTPVVGRIDGLETRIGGLETRMDGLETRMDGLEIRMERLESRMDGLYTAIHQQTRSFIVSMSAVIASFSAVVIATGILT
jgi:hypothetical protein